MRLPKLITVERKGRSEQILVDGVPFPYPIVSVTVSPDRKKIPTVVIELMAERVTVEDSMADDPAVSE